VPSSALADFAIVLSCRETQEVAAASARHAFGDSHSPNPGAMHEIGDAEHFHLVQGWNVPPKVEAMSVVHCKLLFREGFLAIQNLSRLLLRHRHLYCFGVCKNGTMNWNAGRDLDHCVMVILHMIKNDTKTWAISVECLFLVPMNAC